MRHNYLFVLIGLALLALMVGGCVPSYVGSDANGNKITLSEEEYKALPPEAKAAFTEVTGFDQTVIEKKIDPITGMATNVITVTSGFLPPPWDMVGYGLLALLGLWTKAKSVKIAKGSKLAAQAIEAVKALTDSDVWSKTMKPMLLNGEAASTGLLKATMPDTLLSPSEKAKTVPPTTIGK